MSDLDHPESLRVMVLGPREIRQAEDGGRRLAAGVGFSARDCDEIALAVAELGSNLLKHAYRGQLLLEVTEMAGRRGLRVASLDEGPGFVDFEGATADGYSSAGTLGNGLGAVNRLMDELEYQALPGGGSKIICCRWLRTERRGRSPVLDVGAASRPYRQLPENGDAYIVQEWGHHSLVGVIDGLGHGRFAQRAAQAARDYVERHYDQPLEAIFRGVGRTCQATRGVVMSLARFDHEHKRFACANIGNVELRVHGCAPPIRFLMRRGVVGQKCPAPKAEEHPWTQSMTLVMHSDGLRRQWDWNDFPQLWTERPSYIAQCLLTELGRTDDDATVVVVRNRS